ERLIDDHYASESQTLTTGAEQNLLKLAELRGRLSTEQQARWEEIKESFARARMLGGNEDDPASRVVGALTLVSSEIEDSRKSLLRALSSSTPPPWTPLLERVEQALARLTHPRLQVQLAPLDSTPLPEILAHLISLVGLLSRQPPPAAEPVAPQLAQIAARLQQIEAALAGGTWAPPAPLFDVTLGPATPSNLYRGLDGDDLETSGGVFVATYGKLPPHGSRVRLRLHLPASQPVELNATVAFLQQPRGLDGSETNPGFGARLQGVSSELKQQLLRFASLRPPLFHDGLTLIKSASYSP
ncbi:MAG: hypothetical protein MUF64_32835, partial [Polyangiaceae bacterium]|nr:hypothetical protein [Polyangiaceae bacterium]